jgi:aminoglycoside phosphotransferase (APT) family kinase protein
MTDNLNSVSDSEAAEIRNALVDMGLAAPDAVPSISRLSGGVSCDVYRAELGARTICVKRTLPKLRVKADWRAPAERSAAEVAWLKLAGKIVPGSAPAVLGEDTQCHVFAMEFFPPEDFPVWKSELASGRIRPDFAEDVGRAIARIHGATAGNDTIARAFANDAQFLALRLDPFLLYVAEEHPSVAQRLRSLSDGVARARTALMHGDVSPKNILCGPNGPVFLDAETACYGDPAFDLAFCLTHLLLKCVWNPEWREGYLACFDRFVAGYKAQVAWEDLPELEMRAAALVPALLLARVDGKSPAEYLTDESKRHFVRSESISLLQGAEALLDRIAEHWSAAIACGF